MSEKGRTARYYATGTTKKGGKANPKKAAAARKKKAATDKKINARPEQKKKRSELGKIRSKAKANGKKIKGKDYDHATKRFTSVKANRGRKGEGGRKKKSKKK